MGLNTSTPQQHIDTHKAHLELLLGIADTVKNPDVLRARLKELIEANTLAADRKKEAEAAEISIAKASSANTELLKEQARFNSHVEVAEKDIDAQKQALKVAQADFERQKVSARIENDRQIEVAKQLVASAEATRKGTETANAALLIREKNLAAENEVAKARESTYASRVKALDDREKAITARENRLRSALE